MKRNSRILAIIVLILGFIVLSKGAIAQNVVLEGNTFIHKSDSVDTGYRYKDTQGYIYPVYLSASGKAYCWVKSKRGKMYKRYLPKITALLKEAKNGKLK